MEDLIDNFDKTLISIIFLKCYKHPEFKGPQLGPPPANENRREFTEKQLRAGEGNSAINSF